MNRETWERCCAWRAVETADHNGRYLNAHDAAEATSRCRGSLDSSQVSPERLSAETAAFLEKRTLWLEDQARITGRPRPQLPPLELRLPAIPGALSCAGWLGALLLGFVLTQLGNERELNLLALPLVGLLLWNAVVMTVSLFWELLPARAESPRQNAGWLRGLTRLGSSRREQPAEAAVAKIQSAFHELTAGWGIRLLQRRLRAWLHVAAALVALGSVAALFARGWSREYRAVWESTLLDESGAQTFFKLLFGPASWLTRTPVPLEELSAMRRGSGLETQPADALPWLKLYAGTLLLGVALPRLALAGLALLKTRQDLRAAVVSQGWAGHALRLLRRVEGGDRPVLLLAPGAVLDERVRRRWEDWLGQLYGGRTAFELTVVAEGGQDEWVSAWEPQDGRVVVVFFLASTPEEEVQRDFLRQLRSHLEAAHYEPELVVLLDACGLDGRWSPAKREGREQLWLETLGSLPEKVLVADEKGGMQPRERLS